MEATMAEKKVAVTAASRAFLLAAQLAAAWVAAWGCQAGKKVELMEQGWAEAFLHVRAPALVR